MMINFEPKLTPGLMINIMFQLWTNSSNSHWFGPLLFAFICSVRWGGFFSFLELHVDLWQLLSLWHLSLALAVLFIWPQVKLPFEVHLSREKASHRGIHSPQTRRSWCQTWHDRYSLEKNESPFFSTFDVLFSGCCASRWVWHWWVKKAVTQLKSIESRRSQTVRQGSRSKLLVLIWVDVDVQQQLDKDGSSKVW